MTSTPQTGAGYGPDRIDLRGESGVSTPDFQPEVIPVSSTKPSVPVVPPPQQGMKAALWKVVRPVYVQTGWNALRMEASLEEQEAIALDLLWQLSARQVTMAVTSQKGGSAKTTTSCWLAALIMQVLKTSVMALDVNESGGGGTATRLGLDPASTLRTSQLMRVYRQLGTHAALIATMNRHRQTGVGVIASDDVTFEQYSLQEFQNMLTVVKNQTHTLVCDTGNSLVSAGNLSAVNLADVLVLSGREERKGLLRRHKLAKGQEPLHDSLRSIRATMTQYQGMGFVEKISNAQIVIFGAEPKTWKRYAELFGVTESQVHLVPYNSYMAHDYPVDLEKIPLEVRVALLQLAVAIYETPASNDRVDVEAQLAALANAGNKTASI